MNAIICSFRPTTKWSRILLSKHLSPVTVDQTTQCHFFLQWMINMVFNTKLRREIRIQEMKNYMEQEEIYEQWTNKKPVGHHDDELLKLTKRQVSVRLYWMDLLLTEYRFPLPSSLPYSCENLVHTQFWQMQFIRSHTWSAGPWPWRAASLFFANVSSFAFPPPGWNAQRWM